MPRTTLTDKFVKSATAEGRPQKDWFDDAKDTRGLALRVSEGGAKAWAFIYTAPTTGTRARITLGRYPGMTLANARAKVIEAKGHLAAGTDPRDAIAAQDAAAMSVFGLWESWREKHVATLRSAGHIETRMKRNVLPVIGSVRLADLHRRDINRVVDPIIKRGKPTEANRVFENIRAMLRWAVKRGDLDRNPLEGMGKPAAENGARERTLSDDEVRHLWTALPSALPKSKTMQRIVKLALITGQRVGEIAGMRRDELDLKARTWTLPGSRTKNGTKHVVPLTDMAISVIEDALKHAWPDSPVLFPSSVSDPKGRPQPIDPHAVSTAIRRAHTATKDKPNGRFGMAQWTAHDLRRTVLTNLAALGVAPIVIGSVANHLSVTKASITFAVYVKHDYAREKADALNLWAERLAAIVEGDTAKIVPMQASRK